MCCSISFQVWQVHASKAKVGVIKIVEMSLFMIIVVQWVRLRLKHDSTPISAQIHETLLPASAINRKLLSEWDFTSLILFWSRPFNTLNTLTREWALSTAGIERASVITVFFYKKKKKKKKRTQQLSVALITVALLKMRRCCCKKRLTLHSHLLLCSLRSQLTWKLLATLIVTC